MTKSLDDYVSIMKKVNKDHGEGTLTVGEHHETGKVSTGSISLDRALNGGLPMGRIVLFWGNYGATKTTLALNTMANAQAQGLRCLYVDTERNYDTTWASKNGVDNSTVGVLKLNSVENIMEVLKEILIENLFDVVVIDSISAINTANYFDNKSKAVGQQSKALGDLLTKILDWNKHNALIILISQQRTQGIGSNYTFSSFSGGNAVGHLSSVIVSFFGSRAKDDMLYDDMNDAGLQLPVGKKIYWLVEKSRISNAYQKGYYYFSFRGGFDNIRELVDAAVLSGNIKKSGKWLNFGGRQFDGVNNLIKNMREDNTLVKEIQDAVLKEEAQGFSGVREEDDN